LRVESLDVRRIKILRRMVMRITVENCLQPPGSGRSTPSVTARHFCYGIALARGDSSLTREPLKRFAAEFI